MHWQQARRQQQGVRCEATKVPTLIELGSELDRLQSISVRAWGSIAGAVGEPEHDALCDAAVAASGAVDHTIEAIATTPAVSLAELRVKARTLHLLDQSSDALEHLAEIDAKLIRAIVAGLLDERVA